MEIYVNCAAMNCCSTKREGVESLETLLDTVCDTLDKVWDSLFILFVDLFVDKSSDIRCCCWLVSVR